MPKSFLFTHKRYDYVQVVPSQVEVEVVEDDMEEEDEDNNGLQDLSSSSSRGGGGRRPSSRECSTGSVSRSSATSASSSSSGGYSEDESFSPLPATAIVDNGTSRSVASRKPNFTVQQTRLNGNGNTQQARTGSLLNHLKLNNGYHHPVAPKKRRLPPTTPPFQLPKLSSSTTITAVPWQELNNNSPSDNDGIGTPSPPPPQIHIKEMMETGGDEEEPQVTVTSTCLNSSFKSLIVSSSTSSPSTPSSITITPSSIKPDFHHLRGNVIQYFNSHQLHNSPSSSCQSPPPHLSTSSSSYQIKLISPPPGGTLSHHSTTRNQQTHPRDHPSHLLKMETMTPSPLQFILAAAEQQQAEEERMFIEGSRSEESQRYHHPLQHHYHPEPTNHHHHHHLHSPPPLQLQEQPVNLSVKKVDLFNLTQLAEVRKKVKEYFFKL